MEAVDPGSVIGTAIVVLGIVAFVLVVVWMPMQIRKEQRELEAKRLEPIHTPLAGTRETNEDGNERKALIRGLAPETAVVLKRKRPDDPGYPGVSVCLQDGPPIGELPSDPGETVFRELGLGHAIDAIVSEIDGGTEDDPELTVQLRLQRRPEK